MENKANGKRKYGYAKSKHKFIKPGQRGFLATCNFFEKKCIAETLNILNEYGDELYGKEEEYKADNNDEAAEKPRPKPRFKIMDTGAKNFLFIRTLESPKDLAQAIIGDILKTRKQKSRFLHRLIPIEVVCRASKDEIVESADRLFDAYFRTPTTFSVCYKRRINNSADRDDIIGALADLVKTKNPDNKVDLKNGKHAIIVEIVKNICCLSVIEDYSKHKRYNLIELANACSEEKPEDETTVTSSNVEHSPTGNKDLEEESVNVKPTESNE